MQKSARRFTAPDESVTLGKVALQVAEVVKQFLDVSMFPCG